MNFTLLLTSTAVTLLLLLLWLAVQRSWQRSFPERSGIDALAGRFGCGNCACATVCERRQEQDGQDRRSEALKAEPTKEAQA